MLQAREVLEVVQGGLQLSTVQKQALKPRQRGQRGHAADACLGQLHSTQTLSLVICAVRPVAAARVLKYSQGY